MKLTFGEIGIITDALKAKRDGLEYYANCKDDDGNISWPDEARKYEIVNRLIKKIEETEV